MSSTASSDRSAPTTAAIAVATAIVAGLGGFFLGQASSLGVIGGGGSGGGRKKADGDDDDSSDDDAEGADGDDDDDDDDDDKERQELGDFGAGDDECKLVLVVRTDLGMTKGKIAAQCSHATLACYKALLHSSATDLAQARLLRRWERHGQAKVALQVKSEDELEVLQAQAMSLGVCARIVQDAGRTQIASGSKTVLGVGPAPKGIVDRITGGLKLL